MNIRYSQQIPWRSLILLWLAYVLIGWYLSANHVFILFGSLAVALSLAVVWKSIPWFEHLLSSGYQGLLVVLIVSTSLSLLAIWSPLLTLIVIPLVATFLAVVEMRFTGFSKSDTLLFLIVVAGVGLGLGEVIDIVFLPSVRY